MVNRMDQIPVMGDEDQSPASFTARAREKRSDLTCVLIVEVAHRLVGEDERGIVDESPGNRDALLLAAAQFRRPVPGAIPKTDLVEEFQAVPWIRPPLREHRHKNVLECCKLWEQVVGLEDEPDALVAIVRGRGARQVEIARATRHAAL